MHDAKVVGGIEDGVVCGADELLTAVVVIDGHAFVGAGSFAGHEITVGKVDKKTIVSIGRIDEVFATVDRQLSRADYRSRMSRRGWCGLRRLRRLWLRGGLSSLCR